MIERLSEDTISVPNGNKQNGVCVVADDNVVWINILTFINFGDIARMISIVGDFKWAKGTAMPTDTQLDLWQHIDKHTSSEGKASVYDFINERLKMINPL